MTRSHFALTLGLLGVAASLAGPAAAQPLPQSTQLAQSRNQTCEGCHSEAHEEVIPLADGTMLGVWVDTEALARSVHGKELTCTDCHRQIGSYPHAPSDFESRRDLRVDLSTTCNRCHYGHTKKVMDSLHFAQLEAGDPNAPTCVDCHGAHDMKDPSEPRAQISDRCARCHEQVQAEFSASVHSMVGADVPEDLPVCTDCHGAHAIKDPTSQAFHVGEHEVCAKCHADEAKMQRHGLSANILSTYLDDFHGTSNRLYAKVGVQEGRPVATCSDCHGVHDIRSMKDRDGVATMKGRSEQMCAQCHEGATDDFAAAWLSHTEPTLESAPLVWSIKWGYRLLIPMIMLGLVLHIIMDLIQVRTHRQGRA